MGSSWMEGDANLAHQVARGRHEERLARSLAAYAASNLPGGSTGWVSRVVRLARRQRALPQVRIAEQLR